MTRFALPVALCVVLGGCTDDGGSSAASTTATVQDESRAANVRWGQAVLIQADGRLQACLIVNPSDPLGCSDGVGVEGIDLASAPGAEEVLPDRYQMAGAVFEGRAVGPGPRITGAELVDGELATGGTRECGPQVIDHALSAEYAEQLKGRGDSNLRDVQGGNGDVYLRVVVDTESFTGGICEASPVRVVIESRVDSI